MRKRLLIGSVAVVAGGLIGPLLGSVASQADSAPPANSQPFAIAQATVATVEAPGPAHTAFTLSCPIASGQAEPSWLSTSGATNPVCTNGQMTIYVDAVTKFYKETANHSYPPSTYDQTLAPGAMVRIYGNWAREQYSTWEFLASWVFSPGNDLAAQPPNPQPEQPCTTTQSFCTTDYNGNRRFVVNASVVEIGSNLDNGTLWSDKWGMVVGHITNYFSNDHVQAIAAAHRDPVTLDPQLAVYTVDGSTPNGTVTDQGVTKFYIQGPGGVYASSTKSETVMPGALLQVLGDYVWSAGDWRLVARAVLRPAPSVLTTSVIFNAQSTFQSTDTNGDEHFTGASNAGDGSMNPSNVVFDLGFMPKTDGTYAVTGTWSAARNQGTAASVAGGVTGLWHPVTQRLDATVTVDAATGTFCGFTGAGTINGGTAAPNVDGTPATAMNTPLKLTLSKVSATC